MKNRALARDDILKSYSPFGAVFVILSQTPVILPR